MKQYKKYIPAGFAALLIIILVILMIPGKATIDEPSYEVQKGQFEILVTVTGELEAESSIMVQGPQELQSRNIRLRNVPILDMVSEGTIVEAGDWIATLDRTEAELSLRDLQDDMLSEESNYNAAQLDTTISMRSLRDELINLEHEVEERRLIYEQSAFEPPATIRQAEINIQRAELALEQARENYFLLQKEAEEIMIEAGLELQRTQRQFQAMSDLLDKFVITAPESGMIIYHREWNGEKRKVGSTIHSRDLTVVVMPDLSTLVSRAYVSEIDVTRVRVGQQVRIGIDAFYDRSYTGSVIEVSNVGQEMPNTDAKVFEVLILVDQGDGMLRPAMTTSNVIIAGSFSDVHFVPLAAVHEEEGIPYVYKDDRTKQIVVTGASNDNFIIIEKGLETGDAVYLSAPVNGNEFKFVGNELIAEINQ
jgi:HlyD family secretion protein